jgi:hypothetical protein
MAHVYCFTWGADVDTLVENAKIDEEIRRQKKDQKNKIRVILLGESIFE